MFSLKNMYLGRILEGLGWLMGAHRTLLTPSVHAGFEAIATRRCVADSVTSIQIVLP